MDSVTFLTDEGRVNGFFVDKKKRIAYSRVKVALRFIKNISWNSILSIPKKSVQGGSMKKVRCLSIVIIFIMVVFIFSGTAKADNVGPFLLCAVVGNDPLNMPSYVSLTLSAVSYGGFASVVGQATLSQFESNPTSTAPGRVIVYSVNGAASQNVNGWWLSLEGLGYDLAQTPYRGFMAIQLSSDFSNNTFTYSHEQLDGSSLLTFTGSAMIWSATECVLGN